MRVSGRGGSSGGGGGDDVPEGKGGEGGEGGGGTSKTIVKTDEHATVSARECTSSLRDRIEVSAQVGAMMHVRTRTSSTDSGRIGITRRTTSLRVDSVVLIRVRTSTSGSSTTSCAKVEKQSK
jgi:hypothetical protein